MKPGRNDPCPCGSGKKYKTCHARSDAADAPTLRLLGHDTMTEMQANILEAIARPVPWEVDVTPVPANTDPTGRAAAVILAAEGLVLHSDLIARPPSDAAGVAALLADAITTQLARGGAPPSAVFVRHAEVAECLAPLLQPHGVVAVGALRPLPMLDDFAAGLRQHLAGSRAPIQAVSCPQMWAGWALPDEQVHALHAAAATFYRSKPWELLADVDTLSLTMPAGTRWYACVMGAAGETFGVALYESIEDMLNLLETPDGANFAQQLSVVLSLTFDFRADLPKSMRREAADAGWPIAGPSAYPVLWTINTIGGGISESQVRDLTLALEVVARFAGRIDTETNAGAGPVGVSWTDESSGTVVEFPEPMRNVSLWEVPALLSPSLPEGGRANTTDTSDADLLARFVAAARAIGTNEKRNTQDENNVAHFIEVIRFEQRVTLTALSEVDLRIFLYDLMPRRTIGAKSHGHAMRQSLKRFFAYLSASEDLRYPWAAAILGDKFALDERWDSRPDRFADEDVEFFWTAELMEDLTARVLLPEPPDLTGLGDRMGSAEAAIYDDMQRAWLVWRDAAIRAGVREPQALREKLIARQAQWLAEPQSLDGPARADVIASERAGGRRISRRRR